MARRDDNLQTQLDRDLVELKLFQILRVREVLDEASRKGTSMLELLALLPAWSKLFVSKKPSSVGCVRHGSPSKRLRPTRFQIPQADSQGHHHAVI